MAERMSSVVELMKAELKLFKLVFLTMRYCGSELQTITDHIIVLVPSNV